MPRPNKADGKIKSRFNSSFVINIVEARIFGNTALFLKGGVTMSSINEGVCGGFLRIVFRFEND